MKWIMQCSCHHFTGSLESALDCVRARTSAFVSDRDFHKSSRACFLFATSRWMGLALLAASRLYYWMFRLQCCYLLSMVYWSTYHLRKHYSPIVQYIMPNISSPSAVINLCWRSLRQNMTVLYDLIICTKQGPVRLITFH